MFMQGTNVSLTTTEIRFAQSGNAAVLNDLSDGDRARATKFWLTVRDDVARLTADRLRVDDLMPNRRQPALDAHIEKVRRTVESWEIAKRAASLKADIKELKRRALAGLEPAGTGYEGYVDRKPFVADEREERRYEEIRRRLLDRHGDQLAEIDRLYRDAALTGTNLDLQRSIELDPARDIDPLISSTTRAEVEHIRIAASPLAGHIERLEKLLAAESVYATGAATELGVPVHPDPYGEY